jgi:maltose-binding protein MalE
MRISRKVAVAAVASALAFGAISAPVASAADPAIIIWADGAKVDGLKALAAKYTAANVTVLKNTDTKANLPKATTKTGPDIVIGAHDWIGQYSADGLIVKQNIPAPIAAQFDADTYKAFNYGGNQYGLPMSVESAAWVQNTKIMGTKCPATFAEAEAKINAYKGKLVEKISVPGNDPYHHYWMISGLGGYNFGYGASGGLDKNEVGLDNAKFLANAGVWTKWQKSGIVGNWTGKGFGLTNPYGMGQAAVVITGPWNTNDIVALSTRANTAKTPQVKSVVCPFPTIVAGTVTRPFSGVQGLMITKFAGDAGHASVAAAQAFINYASSAANQTTYNELAGALAANKKSTANGKTAAHVAALSGFQKAAAVGTPMPNLPEAGAMWGVMSTALGKVLAKTKPSDPKTTWKQAAANLRAAVKG